MKLATGDGSGANVKNQLPRIGHGSLTEQTTRALIEAILDRRFPNDRLPNEPDLAAQLGVSRTTIRAALQMLDRLGVISRTPGRGTKVRSHIGVESLMFQRLIGFRGILNHRYDDVETKQSFSIGESWSEQARAAAELKGDGKVLLNDKTYWADGHPMVHLLQEIPMAASDGQMADRLVDGTQEPPVSIFDFGELFPSFEIDHTVVEIVPQVVLEGASSSPLGLDPGTPYVEMREVHYSETNEPIAVSREVVDDRFVRLQFVRTG